MLGETLPKITVVGETALTTYAWAILNRIVSGLPIRTETPHAEAAAITLRDLGLTQGAGKLVQASPAGLRAMEAFLIDFQPAPLEWMDDEYRHAAAWHDACEDIFVRNWDAWEALEGRD
jgi:hypothetical protein